MGGAGSLHAMGEIKEKRPMATESASKEEASTDLLKSPASRYNLA